MTMCNCPSDGFRIRILHGMDLAMGVELADGWGYKTMGECGAIVGSSMVRRYS